MASAQVATLTRDLTTPACPNLDATSTLFSHRSLSRSAASNCPPPADDASERENSLTRPRVRRRGNSASPAINKTCTPSPQQPNARPRTSEGLSSPWQLLSPAPSSASTSYFANRSAASSDLRSPTVKRPPASRSSHGVETSAGPPPALKTQRAYSFDLHNKPSPQRAYSFDLHNKPSPQHSLGALYSKLTPHALAQLDAANHATPSQNSPAGAKDGQLEARKADLAAHPSNQNSPREKSSEGMVGVSMERKRYSIEGSRIASQRLSAHLDNPTLAPQDFRSDKSSHEDLFLNMAQGSADDDTVNAGQERKSRIALPAHRLSIPRPQPSEQSSTPKERRSSLKRPELNTEFKTPPSTDRVASRDRAYPATAHPLEPRYASRLSGGLRTSPATRATEQKDVLADSPSLHTKKASETQSYHHRYRSSNLSTTNGTYASPITARQNSLDQEPSPPLPRAAEGTESTVSTTAPSTVWDELDDLKSRIRKLELTGRIPPSSGAAVSSATERPRTAATTATTMSSSPKRNGGKSVSPTTSTGFEEAAPHPLLNSALTKAKLHVSAETYRALEATASDALTLVKMASGNPGLAAAPSALDRQLRRKADNMCRSLTELCISLANGGAAEVERPRTRARSASRDAIILHQPPAKSAEEEAEEEAMNRRFQRARSLDPEPTASQRVLSRLEARRSSMMKDSGANSSPASPLTDHHLDVKTPTQATLNRTSTVLQRIRRAADDTDGESTIRPVSRAATELGRSNTTNSAIGSKRVSREYTSNYPLPSPDARVLVAQGRMPGRRSYLSNGGISVSASAANASRDKELPATPTTPGLAGRRYLSRAGEETTAAAGSRLSDTRQRLASGQHGLSGIGTGRSMLGLRAERKSTIGGGVDGD